MAPSGSYRGRMRFGETPNCQSLLLRIEQALNEGRITYWNNAHGSGSCFRENSSGAVLIYVDKSVLRSTEYGVPWTSTCGDGQGSGE